MKDIVLQLSYDLGKKMTAKEKKVIHKVFHNFHKYKKGKMLKQTQKELKNFFENEDVKKFLKS